MTQKKCQSIIRGGAWGSDAENCRPACRLISLVGARQGDQGFRLTEELEIKYRVVRGGSWYFNPRRLRSSYRNLRGPSNRYNNQGFRLAEDI